MSGMHQAIATLLRAGNNVVAKHVLVERPWLEECARLFADLPAVFVGVRCALDVVEQREAARQDRARFPLVHAHGVYDLQVDTSQASAEACALQIVRWLEEGRAPEAFRRLRG
jgi:chloramphenicol 3-O phosphotransferase